MKKNNLIIISLFVLCYNFIILNLQSQIVNIIVVKVGKDLITSVDVQNEIVTNLLIKGKKITQENINKNKNYAIKNLINKLIKRSEVNKDEVEDYNKKDLQEYIDNVAKNLNTDREGLKQVFKQANTNYKEFVQKHETELLWNTLIYQIYKNQTNVNIVEVENEFERTKENKSGAELKKFKDSILNKKKAEKLNLFSRSHFSNLENSIVVTFQ